MRPELLKTALLTAGLLAVSNLFMLYGPNTNQGCILYMIEQQVGYIVRQIARANAEQLAFIDVKPEVMQAFNDRIQQEIRGVDVWQAECGGEFYYRSASGRFVTQWPNSMDAFREATSRADSEAPTREPTSSGRWGLPRRVPLRMATRRSASPALSIQPIGAA